MHPEDREGVTPPSVWCKHITFTMYSTNTQLNWRIAMPWRGAATEHDVAGDNDGIASLLTVRTVTCGGVAWHSVGWRGAANLLA